MSRPAPYAYWGKNVAPTAAKEHPAFQRIHHAGPWQFATHPEGGTIAFLGDYPEPGQLASGSPDHYGEPVDCGDGLHFLPPKDALTLYDLAFGDRSGEDIVLANGLKVTIPVATSQHRQFRLTARERTGKPITEYGRLALQLFEEAGEDGEGGRPKGLQEEDPRVWRLIALGFSQRYRCTADLLDHLEIITREDVDPVLGVIWCGSPKAMSPARDDAGSSSPSSASEAQTSAPRKPSPSAAGQ